MTTDNRNELFTEHQNLIDITIRRNWRLLAALRLEAEDVAQDLSIKMLSAIEKFDPARSESLPAHIACELQHGILDMKRRHRPHGMTSVKQDVRPEYVYLNHVSDYGTIIEIPSYDDATIIDFNEYMDSLTDYERETLKKKLDGYTPRKKRQIAALVEMRERFEQDYYMQRSA